MNPELRLVLASCCLFVISYSAVAVDPLVAADPDEQVSDQSRSKLTPSKRLDELLKQIAAQPANAVLSGGFPVQQPGLSVEPTVVDQWERGQGVQFEKDSLISEVIKSNADVAEVLNQLLADAAPTDLVTAKYALILKHRGDVRSIPVLIGFLKRADQKPEAIANVPGVFQTSFALDTTVSAATSALWKLTGRKQRFTAKQWQDWWNLVQPDFERFHNQADSDRLRDTLAKRTDELLLQLDQDEESARECLIAIGPSVVPQLLEVIQKKRDQSRGDVKAAVLRSAIQLAWVVDELSATEMLPDDVRTAYFKDRLSRSVADFQSPRIDEDAFCRALSQCKFADICSTLMNGPELNDHQRTMLHWMTFNSHVLSVLMRHKVPWQDVSQFPFSGQIKPVDDPAKEVSDAADVLVEGLKNESIIVRQRACQLADVIGFRSGAQPEKLIRELKEGWIPEPDDRIRGAMVSALARFQSPLISESIAEGLQSERPEILLEAVKLAADSNYTRQDTTENEFARIASLTEDESTRLRRAAVRCLQWKAPRLLDFPRLVKDPNDDIREACARALFKLHEPQYVDVLFELVDDRKEQIRTEALSSIGRMKDKASLERLVPYLKDKQIHGFAVSALAQAGGVDAMPLLMHELKSGNDVGGLIYQHLTRISGQSLGSKPEPWIEWWSRNSASLKSEPKSADCRIIDDATSEPIDDERFTVRVAFRVRKTETTTEQQVARVTMTKRSGKFSLLIPAIVVNHADYNDIVADIEISHPDYELVNGKFSVSAFALMADMTKLIGKDVRDFRVKRKTTQ